MSAFQVDLISSDVPEVDGHHRERLHSNLDAVVLASAHVLVSRTAISHIHSSFC